MTHREQAAAVRLLAQWMEIAGRVIEPTSKDGFAAVATALELLRIETAAFVAHEPVERRRVAG